MRFPWSTAVAFAVVTQVVAVAPAAAQNEHALRTAFEGRSITLRMDMPATSQGVDVFPQEQLPVDFRTVAQRLKDNGTAVRTGQSIMITKVTVKGTTHIEFQLGGGGYGTFMDWATSGNEVSTAGADESPEERRLRDAMKNASGDDKKRMERELDALRSTRMRENSRAAAEAQQANMAREANLRSKRLDAGSRFNIRYKHGLPPEAITPEGVMRALAQYVDFGTLAAAPGLMPGAAPAAMPATAVMASNPGQGAVAVPVARALTAGGGVAPAAAAPIAAPAADAAPAPAAPAGIGALRKGLTLAEVERALGPAATASESRDGSMTVTKRTYRPEGMQVVARFVGGVLVDYTVTPR